ncbi:flavin reductase family protein [Chelatococcus sp. GCM10030263]|uniref:flavin reductase family protein n=1 Tax=Chelatococcus sp. GCM10030263 TaxID=3273387 RepID=UPI00361F0ABE
MAEQQHLSAAPVPRMEPNAFDARLFRRALGQFATGVAVVTGLSPAGERLGMTVSSFNAVSLEPPLVLFSIARGALSLPAMLELEGYAVNVLSREQANLSGRFARPASDKWTDIEHATGHAGAPLLPGVLAHFECAAHARHDGGDHVIFVGRVVSFAWNDETEPLLFFRGAYREVNALRAEQGRSG